MERRCSVTVSQANGIVSCWEGVQSCVGERWGKCDRGSLTERPDPTGSAWSGEARVQSLSGPPEPCIDNPCDPSCQSWFEEGELSGGVGGGLPSYPGFPETQQCTHDLCVAGPALEASCNECVTAVCAEDPSCCNGATGSWDDACVDAVYTLCAGRQPPLNICDFTLFADGILRVAGPLVGDIEVGANQNIDIGVGVQVRRIVSRQDVFITNGTGPASPYVAPEGIYALGNVSVQASARTGPIESGGNVWLASQVHVLGDVRARGSIEGQDATTRVTGNARAGTTIGGSLTVLGTRTEGSSHPVPEFQEPVTIPTRTLDCSGTGYYTGDGSAPNPENRVVRLPPGNYGTVELRNGGVLELEPGDYTFNTLFLNGSIRLLDTSSLTNVNVCGDFNLGNGARILQADGTQLASPAAFSVYVDGTNVHMETNVHFTGILIAPRANFYKSPNGSINGAIWTRSLNTIEPGQTISGMSRSECLSSGIPELEIPACPIPPTTPAVPPALNEPCSSGLDCQMNHRCEEPVTAAACAHGKCEVGDALAAACDPCVARICEAEPACCAAEWSAACVARVATVCDAVCGGGESGTCVPNAGGYRDETCAGYDLALGVPCGGRVPVCNHGTQDFSGNVRVGYFAEADRVMATPTPQLARMDGSCQEDLTIQAGRCASLDCALPSGRHTLIVDPAGVLSECDGRRLDNWTVADESACGGGSAAIHVLDYQATCDVPGTSPRWGLLSWHATVPGTSRIEFSARVASSASEVALLPFSPLATADVDRQDCLLQGPLPCPIDVTRELALGPHQGSYLELHIEITPGPGVEPVLEDWKLTYSCVFDE